MATLELKPNTTINLTPGVTYDAITGLVGPYSALPANCSIRGNKLNPGVIAFQSSQGYCFKNTSPGQVFDGICFTKGGLFLEGAGLKATKVDGNVFSQSATTGPKLCGLTLSGAADTLEITNNLFSGTNGNFGLYGDAGGTRITVANNEFRDIRAGLHLAGIFAGLIVEQNYLTGIVAQAIELQGGGTGIIIQDNWVENHRLLPSYAQNKDAYSYSVPLQDAISPVVQRNVSLQKKSADEPDQTGVRIVFEIGGKNVSCTGNYSRGANHVIAGNGAGGTGSASNNNLDGYREAPRNKDGVSIVYTNNGPNVVLPVDLIARGRPRRFVRFGAAIPVPPIVIEDPELAKLRAENAKLTAERDAANTKIAKAQEALR